MMEAKVGNYVPEHRALKNWANRVSLMWGGNLGGSGGVDGRWLWLEHGEVVAFKSPLGLVFLEWGYLLVNP